MADGSKWRAVKSLILPSHATCVRAEPARDFANSTSRRDDGGGAKDCSSLDGKRFEREGLQHKLLFENYGDTVLVEYYFDCLLYSVERQNAMLRDLRLATGG